MTRRHPVGTRTEAARRIRDELRHDIQSGSFKNGLLPSEHDLMIQQNASRSAVRLALSLLRSEGLVTRLQGRGTTVIRETPVFVPLDPPAALADVVEGGRTRVRFTNLSLIVTAAQAGVAGKLGLDVGDRVVFLERLMFLDDEPCTLRASWIPEPVAEPIMTGRVNLQNAMFQLLENEVGLDVGVVEFSIEATLSDETVSSLLGVVPGSPLLLVENLTRLRDGSPVEYGFARTRADRVRFVTDVSISPRSS